MRHKEKDRIKIGDIGLKQPLFLAQVWPEKVLFFCFLAFLFFCFLGETNAAEPTRKWELCSMLITRNRLGNSPESPLNFVRPTLISEINLAEIFPLSRVCLMPRKKRPNQLGRYYY